MKLVQKQEKEIAFDNFYRQYAPVFYGIAYRMVQNHFDALDIVQEGFLRAYRNWEKFQEKSKFSTWLYRIIINFSYDFLRKKMRKEKADRYKEIVKNPHFDGEKDLLQNEVINKIKRELETLTLKQKTVFILRTYEELSYSEIAKIMRSRIGTVKATYFQAVQKLRKQLKEIEVIKNEM